VGAPLADYLGLPDASIELKLTPNRADCFGVHGIAFDVAAATGCDVEPLDTVPVPAAHDAVLPVELNAGRDAPRFVGRVIDGVDATVQQRRCGWPSACAAAACARSVSWSTSPST
jgi:phenylalanyl-tRNA synthetase beta chain